MAASKIRMTVCVRVFLDLETYSIASLLPLLASLQVILHASYCPVLQLSSYTGSYMHTRAHTYMHIQTHAHTQ